MKNKHFIHITACVYAAFVTALGGLCVQAEDDPTTVTGISAAEEQQLKTREHELLTGAVSEAIVNDFTALVDTGTTAAAVSTGSGLGSEDKTAQELYSDIDSLIVTGNVHSTSAGTADTIDPEDTTTGSFTLDDIRAGRSKLPQIADNTALPAISQDYDDKDYIHTNIYMTLSECIAMGLARNLGLTIERYNPSISYEGIRRARSVFDPQLYGLVQWSGRKSPRPYEKYIGHGDSKIVIGNSGTVNSEYSGRISGKFITGMEYTFRTGMTSAESDQRGGLLNPSYTTFTEASIVVPIMKGFGINVNLAPIRIARNDWKISKQQLSEAVQNLIAQVIQAYFVLYYYREDAAAQEYTLQLAYELRAINEAKVKVGMAAPIEVTQAEAQIARDEESLIVAKNAILDAEDNLRQIINYRMDELFRPKAFRKLQYHIVPLEKPQVYDIDLREEELIDTALANRQSMEIAKLQLQNSKQSLIVAKNNLLPELNGIGTLGYTGLGGNFGNAFDDQFEARHHNWTLGLEMQVPLFYNEPIATFRQARYSMRQSEENVQLVMQQIAIEVRTAFRSVRTNRKRIDASRESTRLSREQLLAEQEKYNVGQSTTFQVLTYQQDLADALSTEIQSLADWRISVAELARVTGTILEFHGVVIDDYYKLPGDEEPFVTQYIWK